MKILSLISIFLMLHSALFAQLSRPKAPRVQTTKGIIEGEHDSGIKAFRGIPFAKPPIGELRWKAPQPMDAWEGVKATKKFGPRGMQRPLFSDMNFRSDGMSEDCLYLNVWTPAVKGDEKLPVLVYFYGGGLFTGDGSEYRYDGESIARLGIISITVNYRLNVFGYLSHPELTAESPHNASGNYGFLDQQAALIWVRDNIETLGGDPNRVTVAGESAGSVSSCAQMASPLSKDLIAGAIGSSASLMGTLGAISREDGEKRGLEFQKALGANSLAELRAKSAEEILEATKKFGWSHFSSTIDGYFFPKSVYEIFEKGEQAQVPLLLGWNSAEGHYSSILRGAEATKKNYRKAIEKIYPAHVDQAWEVYGADNKEAIQQAATDLAGDNFTGFSTWKWGDIHLQTSDQPVYRYFFMRPRPQLEGQPKPVGAVHSAEIEYAMGNLPTNRVYNWAPEDYEVSQIFQAYYANFVKTGDPNALGLPNWPQLARDNGQVMYINAETKAGSEKHRDRYLFLDKIRANQ